MKQLMIGNAAVARGLYEAGCALLPVIRVRQVPRLRKKQLSTMRFIVSGRQMRK